MKTWKIFIIIGIQASMDVGEKCQLSKLFTHSASRRQAEHKSDILSPSKCLYWLVSTCWCWGSTKIRKMRLEAATFVWLVFLRNTVIWHTQRNVAIKSNLLKGSQNQGRWERPRQSMVSAPGVCLPPTYMGHNPELTFSPAKFSYLSKLS